MDVTKDTEHCDRCANPLEESQIGLCDSCQEDDTPADNGEWMHVLGGVDPNPPKPAIPWSEPTLEFDPRDRLETRMQMRRNHREAHPELYVDPNERNVF
jgi:hypothetical protein